MCLPFHFYYFMSISSWLHAVWTLPESTYCLRAVQMQNSIIIVIRRAHKQWKCHGDPHRLPGCVYLADFCKLFLFFFLFPISPLVLSFLFSLVRCLKLPAMTTVLTATTTQLTRSHCLRNAWLRAPARCLFYLLNLLCALPQPLMHSWVVASLGMYLIQSTPACSLTTGTVTLK